jgi:hypothetical protein
MESSCGTSYIREEAGRQPPHRRRRIHFSSTSATYRRDACKDRSLHILLSINPASFNFL